MRIDRLVSLLLGCTVTLGATSAAAAEGAYGGVAGGANFARDQGLGDGRGMARFDEGGLGLFTLGYAFTWLRPELELAYRTNDTGEGTDAAGEAQVPAAMVNVWHDMPAPAFAPKLRPYIGAGAGSADLGLDMVGQEEAVFAWQVGAGLSYELTPRLALTAGYRYFETNEPDFDVQAVPSRYRSDAALLGIRFGFGEPSGPLAAATPEPVQMEAAAFETVVLRPVNFQFDRSELTGPAQATLDEIAARLVAQPELGVLIEGHTDAIGSDGYNMGLGQRRAMAVFDYLVQRGVRPESLRTVSRGETEPVADNGTPEGRAQNRRAEFSAEQKPADVKIVIEGPTEASIDAADDALDPGR